MATVLEPVQRAVAEERFVLRGVDWNVYKGILLALGDHRTRVTFDGRNLELMSPLPIHEFYTRMFDRLLVTLAFEAGLSMRNGGSMTFRREDIERGLEPDSCFWIQNEFVIRGKQEIDLTVDPPPDLAIEIEISRSALDRLAIYAKLGIPEVWRFDGELLRIHLLQSHGVYAESQTSRCIPELPVQEMVPFLQPDDQLGDTMRVRQFVEWASPRFKRQ